MMFLIRSRRDLRWTLRSSSNRYWFLYIHAIAMEARWSQSAQLSSDQCTFTQGRSNSNPRPICYCQGQRQHIDWWCVLCEYCGSYIGLTIQQLLGMSVEHVVLGSASPPQSFNPLKPSFYPGPTSMCFQFTWFAWPFLVTSHSPIFFHLWYWKIILPNPIL